MRNTLVVANWKMQKTVAEALAFAEAFLARFPQRSGQALLPGADAAPEVAVAAPFTALYALGRALQGTPVALAAQNVHPQAQGAFTGEVAPGMLAELGCRYAIVGHSERRNLFDERSDFVAEKAAALLQHGIDPIVCVGESVDQRGAGRTLTVIREQVAGSLAKAPSAAAQRLVVAYEPVWAIGAGVSATPEQAQEVHAAIRACLQERFGAADSEKIRILYGGSVKADNVSALVAQPDIDGALVGGASLQADGFAELVLRSGDCS